MSEEQRAKYAELIGMMTSETLEQDTVQVEAEVDSDWCVAIANS